MFATSNKHIVSDAGQLASKRAGVFYARRHSITLYRYPCTPVYWLNGRTASETGCVRQRDRHGYLLFYILCKTISLFPTRKCLSATERRPTKRVFNVYLLSYPIYTRRISGTKRTGLPGFLISPAGKPPWGQPLYPN